MRKKFVQLAGGCLAAALVVSAGIALPGASASNTVGEQVIRVGIYFGSDSKHVAPSIKLISSIINDLASSPVSEKALDAAKKQFIGQLLVSSDNNEALALSMGKSFLYYGHVADNEETTAHIMDVTPSQIMEAAAIISPTQASTLTFE